jgi:hypothetical protein
MRYDRCCTKKKGEENGLESKASEAQLCRIQETQLATQGYNLNYYIEV